MIRYHHSCIIFIIAILAVLPASAEVFVWTDGSGVRHYSNIAPPDRGEITLLEETIRKIQPGLRFKVTRIFDGDTIEVSGADLIFKVRLVGIDTPETGHKGQQGQPYAQEAKQALKEMIADHSIHIKQYGTGGYNRVLAEVFAGGRNLNLELVKKGLAEIYGGKLPAGLDAAAYKKAQGTARAKKSGIWSLGKKYKSPRQWRKENPWK